MPTEALLLLALVPLVLFMLLARRAETLGPAGCGLEPGALRAVAGSRPEAGAGAGAVRLIFSSRLLIAVACVTMLLNWVNTNGENLLFRVFQEFLGDETRRLGIEGPSALLAFTRGETTVFYGTFYFWVNSLTLVLQAFVASRLLKYGGFGVMLLFAPTISLIAYSGMALMPILAVVRPMKVVDNATDYSISNTARNVLWLPVPARIKLKAKPAVDSLFARTGDGLAALTVLIGVQLLDLGTGGFFVFTVGLVLAWLFVSVLVVREHAQLTAGQSGGPPADDEPGVRAGRSGGAATAEGSA